MHETIAFFRRFAVSVYRKLPGKPFHSLVVRVDRFLKERFASHVQVVKRDGITYELDLSCMIDGAIFYEGGFEKETLRSFERVVHEGMTVFDIGANVGSHTLPLARLVGEQGKVHAFEPTQWGVDKITRNLQLNPNLAERVLIHRLAVSDGNSEAQPYSFTSRWKVLGGECPPETGLINYMTLDAFCESRSIESLGFIKLDVDGCETKILRGAKHTLQRYRPALLIELGKEWQEQTGESLSSLLELIEQSGYQFFSENDFRPTANLRAELDKLPGRQTMNVYCMPQS